MSQPFAVLPAALAIILLTGLPQTNHAEAFLVRDIETEGVPLPDPQCPFEPESCFPVFGSLPDQLTPLGDLLVFTAYDTAHGKELWKSDGTAEGTELIADLALGEEGSRPDILGLTGHGLMVSARNADDPESLFVVSGSGAEPVGSGHEGLGQGSPLATAGGRVHFPAGTELWASDGTREGTGPVAELCMSEDQEGCRISELAAVGEDVYVVTTFRDATDLERRARWEIHRFRQAPEGSASPLPELVTVAETCLDGFGIYELTPFRGGLLFVTPCMEADPNPDGLALYYLDGQGVRLLVGGPGEPEDPGFLTVAGDLAFFQVSEPGGGRLWRTDGTRAGTRRHLDLHATYPVAVGERVFFLSVLDPPGEPGARMRLMVTAAGQGAFELLTADFGHAPSLSATPAGLAFAAATPGTGREPWFSDGTPGGTVRLGDVAPGPASSLRDGLPRDFAQVGDLLYFEAATEELGRELWAARLDELPPPEPPYPSWIESAEALGFRFQVRITGPGAAPLAGRREIGCEPETVCVSGALPGRSEVFLRVLGPRPNGFFWPTVVRFTSSRVGVWVEQLASGEVRYYDLPPVAPGDEDLSGRQDRTGFRP